METIKINDVEYVRKDQIKNVDTEGLRYCVVRTCSAGVHIGYVKEFALTHPQSATLINARRLYSWEGACSLSQVAVSGVSKNSKLSVPVELIYLTDVIEVIPCTIKAATNLQELPEWKK